MIQIMCLALDNSRVELKCVELSAQIAKPYQRAKHFDLMEHSIMDVCGFLVNLFL